jgi:hypothetical protein
MNPHQQSPRTEYSPSLLTYVDVAIDRQLAPTPGPGPIGNYGDQAPWQALMYRNKREAGGLPFVRTIPLVTAQDTAASNASYSARQSVQPAR